MSFNLPTEIPSVGQATVALVERYQRTGFVSQSQIITALTTISVHCVELEKRVAELEKDFSTRLEDDRMSQMQYPGKDGKID